jgi:alcohol dehydrogenase
MLFGAGAAAQTGQKAAGFGWSKVVFIYDKGVKATGITDKVEKSLIEAGISWVEYDGIVPDPPDTIVEEAAELARKEQVDGVIAVGGGSSLDVAKCVSILLSNPSPVGRYYGVEQAPNPPTGAILLPTTAGTGSEVSDVAIITDTVHGVKVGVAGKYSMAKLAIIDPELTYGLPTGLTAQTAMDAFAHGFEAYTGTGNNPMSDLYAEKTMRLVVENLPLALAAAKNVEARTALSFAASVGALSFGDSMAHLGHNFGQNVGTLTHFAHGVTCMLGVLSIIEFIADAVPDRIRFVGALFGLDPSIPRAPADLGREVAARYKTFIKNCGMPTSWGELGVPKNVLEPASKLIAADPILTLCAPKPIDAGQALALLKKHY